MSMVDGGVHGPTFNAPVWGGYHHRDSAVNALYQLPFVRCQLRVGLGVGVRIPNGVSCDSGSPFPATTPLTTKRGGR